MRKSFLVAALLSLLVSGGATAEQPHSGTAEEQKACARDVQKFCRTAMNESDITVLNCLQQNRARLTKSCDQVLTNHGQ